MDEAITCKCRSQSWVVGTSGVRCAKCGWWLPRDIDALVRVDISEVNERIDQFAAAKEVGDD